MRVRQDVIEVLERGTCDGDRLRLPEERLDRGLYVAVNKVLEALGGKWNRRAQAHVFDGDASELVETVLLTGEVGRCQKQDFGYFPTPRDVVGRLIHLAQIRPGMRYLEPSAGRGNIALALAELLPARLDCIEIQRQHADALLDALDARADRGADFFGYAVRCQDFLAAPPDPRYDRVLMNPPFGRQADIAHVTHALDFLAEGGRLVSVMSAGVMFRTNRAAVEFRDLVASRGGLIEELPDGSFRSSGTDVRSCIVVVDRR